MYLVAIVSLKKHDSFTRRTSQGVRWGMIFGLSGSVAALFYITALYFGPGAVVVTPVAFGIMPAAAALGAYFFDRPILRNRAYFLSSLLIFCLGVLLVVVYRPIPLTAQVSSSSWWWGALSMAVFLWAMFSGTMRRAIKENDNDIRWAIFYMGCGYTVVALLALSVVLCSAPLHQASLAGIALSLSAGMCGALGTILSIIASKVGPGSVTVMTITFGLTPVSGGLMGVLLSSDSLSVSSWYILGVFIVSLATIGIVRSGPSRS